MKIPLILASSSVFRQSILKKINLPFSSFNPEIDETALNCETPEQLVLRLAEQKAHTAKKFYSQGLVIGSDQVAVHQNQVLGKPHTKPNAIAQLRQFSGQKVTFLTSLCLYNIEQNKSTSLVEPFHVYFRILNDKQISAYCDIEQPYQCAGSFKSEGLGICLFDKLEGDDPNSLIGLPLIRLTQLLLAQGVDVLTANNLP
ncbi:nucleoside triphosphate pyrophosphatase [Pseudoalteromonas sp. MMG012]|uniref:Maf family protein n=1 Tax=Pseudoalteromonas sp. MMG012 TaxID=2822686 RepID=UPI001B3A149F|nr:Maf family protein [Pseudoalteromonas sp. MMG012]MBQ4850038.1 septum formation inhibitor Maf [Pseudoalteromonas sp. MMG012]